MFLLTKKQNDDLKNCHIGVGFIAFHSTENGVTMFEFYIDRGNRIRTMGGKELELNKVIVGSCIFEE